MPHQAGSRARWGLWGSILLIGMIAGIALIWALGLIRPFAEEVVDTPTAVTVAPPMVPRSPYPSDLPNLSGRNAPPAPMLPPIAPPISIAEPPPMAVEPPVRVAEARPSIGLASAHGLKPDAARRPAAAPDPVRAVSRKIAPPVLPPVARPASIGTRSALAPVGPRSLSGPLAALFGPGDYPAAARRAGQQGDVTVRLEIGTDGRVTRCTVLASNASNALEGVTCSVLARRARFAPATDSSGTAVTGVVVQHIAWR